MEDDINYDDEHGHHHDWINCHNLLSYLTMKEQQEVRSEPLKSIVVETNEAATNSDKDHEAKIVDNDKACLGDQGERNSTDDDKDNNVLLSPAQTATTSSSGIDIPYFLQPFLGGIDFVPFFSFTTDSSSNNDPVNDSPTANFHKDTLLQDSTPVLNGTIPTSKNSKLSLRLCSPITLADIASNHGVMNQPTSSLRKNGTGASWMRRWKKRNREVGAAHQQSNKSLTSDSDRAFKHDSGEPITRPAPIMKFKNNAETTQELTSHFITMKEQLQQLDLDQLAQQAQFIQQRAHEIQNYLDAARQPTQCYLHLLEDLTRRSSLCAADQDVESKNDQQEVLECEYRDIEVQLERLENKASLAAQKLVTLLENNEPTILSAASRPSIGKSRRRSTASLTGLLHADSIERNDAPQRFTIFKRHVKKKPGSNKASSPLCFQSPDMDLAKKTCTAVGSTPEESLIQWCPSSALFIRVTDLEKLHPTASGSDLIHQTVPCSCIVADEEFLSVGSNLGHILDKLVALGWTMATDETNARFVPYHDERQVRSSLTSKSIPNWPVSPWHACSSDEDYVMMWSGCASHKGLGHDWPIVKARCMVQTSPRMLLDFLMDSSKIQSYNKMSLGRNDLLTLHDDSHSTATDSNFGFTGSTKIMQSLIKPSVFVKTIETLVLWHARPLATAPGACMIVTRSVWENDLLQKQESGGADETHIVPSSNSSPHIRSEMLLGVYLLRPCGEQRCELTHVSHVHTPGIPDLLAKRAAPNAVLNMMRGIQECFRTTAQVQ